MERLETGTVVLSTPRVSVAAAVYGVVVAVHGADLGPVDVTGAPVVRRLALRVANDLEAVVLPEGPRAGTSVVEGAPARYGGRRPGVGVPGVRGEAGGPDLQNGVGVIRDRERERETGKKLQLTLYA